MGVKKRNINEFPSVTIFQRGREVLRATPNAAGGSKRYPELEKIKGTNEL